MNDSLVSIGGTRGLIARFERPFESISNRALRADAVLQTWIHPGLWSSYSFSYKQLCVSIYRPNQLKECDGLLCQRLLMQYCSNQKKISQKSTPKGDPEITTARRATTYP